MNTNEPITGSGIVWAIGQINKRFERAAAQPDTTTDEASSVHDGNDEQGMPLISLNP